MNAGVLIEQLACFPAILGGVVDAMPEAALLWKPSESAWSIVEILGHLLCEEQDDFRPRLSFTLEDPERPWPPIDPPARVAERGFAAAGPRGVLADFSSERAHSIQWLRSLTAPGWTQAHSHPRAGSLRAGDLLLAWTVHDALHLRQIAQRLAGRACHSAPGFDSSYAGP